MNTNRISDLSDDAKSEMLNSLTNICDSPISSKLLDLNEKSDIDSDADPVASKNKNPFIFFRRKDIPLLILALVSNALSACTHVAITIMMNRIFNKLNDLQMGSKTIQQFMSELPWACFSIALIGLGGWIFGWMETTFFSYLGERQQIRCRRMLYRSLLARDYSWFETRKGLDGDLIQLNRSVEEYRTAIAEYFSMLCGSIFVVIALSITSFIYSWRLTLLVLASFPIMSMVIIIFGKPVQKWANCEDEETSNTISHIDWNLLSFIWVKIIHSKDLENSKLKSLLDKCEHAYRKFTIFTSFIGSTLTILSMMMFVQSFWFGSWLVKQQYNTPGEVIAAFYACLSISMTIASLSALTVVFQKASASFGKVMRFMLDSELEKSDDDNEIEKTGEALAFNLDGDIEFKDISFAYSARKDDQVLKKISFKIPKNKMSFIIGKSGSGKSTISSLLAKLYKPSSGSITIDGYDLAYLDETYLREQITLVQQFPTIFNEKLRTNLTFGTSTSEADSQSLYDAITIFNLNELITSLPNGLDTFLGSGKEEIVQLSGGQEQRLNLARARLRDSPILVLDESISAIDIQQRSVLMKRIRDWRFGKTTIIITHELSQINHSDDNVFLINRGEIVESGPRNQLNLFDSLDMLTTAKKEEKRKSHFEFEEADYFNTEQKQSLSQFRPTAGADLQKQKYSGEEEYEDLTSIRGPIFIAYRMVMELMPLKFKITYLLGLFISISSAMMSPLFSFFISKLINGIVPVSMGGFLSTSDQLKWAMAATSLAIAQGLLGFLSSSLMNFSAERFCKTLRVKTFEKILNQDVTYFENVKANEISTLIMNDMRDFRSVVAGTLSHILCGIAIFVCCVTWTLTIGWKFALVGFSLFPMFGLFSLGTTFLMQGFEFNYKDRLNTLEDLIHDTRVGIKTILCLNLKTEFQDQFETKLIKVLKLGFLRAIAMGCVVNVASFVTNLSQAILYYYGLKLVATGEYTLVAMTQIVMMITMSTAYIAHIMSGAPGIYRGLRVAIKLNSILKLADNKNEVGGFLNPNLDSMDTDTAFQFKNASFAYPSAPDTLVLNKLDLRIPANTIFSFVGESGCGKSTIISLLLRLYKLNDTSGGELELNGYDINTIKLPRLRNTIAVVSQKHFFFDGSFRENLLYNHPRPETINNEKIMKVLEKLDLDHLIKELPSGLDSNLGVSRQLLVSGGQAQRLSIARALLRPSSILILDECTSSLDSQSANKVMELLHELKKEKTIICITHKQEMMIKSDIICYLKDGKVAEQGTYKTLMSHEQHFYEMVKTIA